MHVHLSTRHTHTHTHQHKTLFSDAGGGQEKPAQCQTVSSLVDKPQSQDSAAGGEWKQQSQWDLLDNEGLRRIDGQWARHAPGTRFKLYRDKAGESRISMIIWSTDELPSFSWC